MAETPTNTPKPAGFPDAAKHNAEVAATVLKQDLINTPAEVQPASDALDALAAEVTKKKEAEGATPPPDKKEDKTSTPPAKVDDGGTPPDNGTPPTEAEKKAADEAKAKEDADRERVEKIFKDSPSLPAGASPKSSEAFSAIKIKAAQEISARETELEKLKAEKTALEEKLKTPIPPELAKEVDDLRSWRAKLDVEADPKFKEFDKNISAAHEFIYAQLQKSPVVTPAVIEEIKKHGGPEMVQMTKIFEAIKDPTLQRLVESKIADIEMQKYNKDQAIKDAKVNIQKYLTDREQQIKASEKGHTTATQQRLDPMIKQLDWLAKKTADEKADPEAKKSIEEHNAFVDQTNQQLSAALQDDSADMRAILLVGMAQLFNLQRVHAGTTKELEAAKKSLEEVTAKWEKMKGASTSRLRESGAPSTGLPKPKPADNINLRPGDALDSIAKQVMEARQAAGTGAS